jgi:hypothetical protein
MDFIEPHEAEDWANAGHRWQERQGSSVMVLSGLDTGAFQVGEQRVVVGDEGQVDFAGLLPRWVGNALSDAVSVRLVRDVLAALGQVVWASGMLHMGQQFSALAPQVGAATSEVAGRAHRGGIDLGLGEHAATPQRRNLVGIDRVMFGLAAVNGVHLEGMPQDEGKTLVRTAISQPVPGEQTFDGHHEAVTIGRHGLQKGCGGGLHIPVDEDLSLPVQDAEVHGAGL